MKKQNAYTIMDDIFMDMLEIIHDYFGSTPYAIVGGGAVQIYVSSIAMKDAGLTSIKDANGLSFMLRRTGDIDLSFRHDLSELVRTFNLIIEHSPGKYDFHSFVKRFVIQRGSHRFNLNYQTEYGDLKGITSYYDEIIRTAIAVHLPYKDKSLRLRIARPEYLIASKLTRTKPKDQVDIVMLLKAMETDEYLFDSEEVRSILKSVGKEDNYRILAELADSV